MAVLLLLGAAAVSARSPEPVADPRAEGLGAMERLDALIERVRQEQSKVKTLEARFVQRQESELLLDAEESEGLFSFEAPDQVRWEYRQPTPITLVISGSEMTTWYKDLNRAERIQIGRYSNQVLGYLGASGSMTRLLEYFDVEAAFPKDTSEPYRLNLTPRFDRIAKRLQSMTIWIDAERFLPTRLRYVAGNGDLTEYSFEAYRVNEELPESRFSLDLPDDVEVREIELDRG